MIKEETTLITLTRGAWTRLREPCSDSLTCHCRSNPDMWSKVAHQMAAPWRMREAIQWQMEKQELVHLTAISSSRTGNISGDGTAHSAPQVDRLPKLRMPIERDTVLLPSFKEMFSDVPSP